MSQNMHPIDMTKHAYPMRTGSSQGGGCGWGWCWAVSGALTCSQSSDNNNIVIVVVDGTGSDWLSWGWAAPGVWMQV